MKRSGLVWGILLVLAGLFALAVQWMDLGGESIILLMGIGFFVVYIATRKPGWVIPAMLLVCIGLGVLLTERFVLPIPESVLVIALLALAFFLMHPFVYRKQGNWPLFPGITLLAVALIAYMAEDRMLAHAVWHFVDRYWPAGLIVLGLWIILAQALRPRKMHQQWHQPIPPYTPPQEAEDGSHQQPTHQQPAPPSQAEVQPQREQADPALPEDSPDDEYRQGQ